jgi:hypothetical protein
MNDMLFVDSGGICVGIIWTLPEYFEVYLLILRK